MSEGKRDEIKDLSDSLEASFSVANKVNDPARPHPRFSSYKAKKNEPSQETRRRQHLEFQKSRRDNFLAIARDIAGGVTDPNDEDAEDEDTMDTTDSLKKKYSIRRRFNDQLMESEWLVDVPSDLALGWTMVPVPVGRRCFLVAGYGTTSHYSRSGYFINSFPSLLPGGCRKNSGPVTFLDCIYVELEKTYFILDSMIWNNFSLYDCDTECRRFFVQSKIDECSQLGVRARINPYIFKILPSYSCDLEVMKSVLNSPLSFHPLDLDGLLFYNKAAHYFPGSTPLVGWLKGYMVPELLGINVSDTLMSQRPNTYASMKNYIDDFKEQRQFENN